MGEQRKDGETYIRSLDGVRMMPVAPHQYVNEFSLRKLGLATLTGDKPDE